MSDIVSKYGENDERSDAGLFTDEKQRSFESWYSYRLGGPIVATSLVTSSKNIGSHIQAESLRRHSLRHACALQQRKSQTPSKMHMRSTHRSSTIQPAMTATLTLWASLQHYRKTHFRFFAFFTLLPCLDGAAS